MAGIGMARKGFVSGCFVHVGSESIQLSCLKAPFALSLSKGEASSLGKANSKASWFDKLTTNGILRQNANLNSSAKR